MNLLSDGKKELLKELAEIRSKLDDMKSEYLKLHVIYTEKRRRYEKLDRAWAERDGRCKIIVSNPSEVKKKQKQLTSEEASALLAELESLLHSKE